MTADAAGGVWTYALDLASGLRERGVTTILAALGPPVSDAQRAAAEAVAGVRLIETGLPLDWTAESRTQIVDAGRAIAALAAELGCDLVHLNSPALAAEARFPCPVIAVCHSCVATWWAAVRGGRLPDDFAWRTDLVRAGYKAADMLLAPTAAFARTTAEAYSLSKLPRAIHNGRAARPAPAAADRATEPFILTAGRLWDEGKNVATLDRVAAHLPSPVLAAGPTAGPNGAAIAIRHAKALGHVPTAALDALFAARPVFVSPALYEPFGLAVLEAAQAACPLVLSDITTFRELWDGAALFVAPRAEDSALGVLERLLADPEERNRLGRAAQERAARYTVTAMVDRVEKAYRDVLARKRTKLMTAA
ncbi:glycosyltransferase family 4 protein [Enterovirga aerilata]|nr:glycosyltransferase family 4 protein [Enterovirga sp. DB1703]